MTAHAYTVWIYKTSATDLSSGAVAYTYQTQLQSVPEPRTPIIRPLEGRAETRSWTVDIVDSGSTVTGVLADSTGRFHLLNRIIAVKRAVGSGGSTWLGVGRIADVTLNDDVASYRLTVEDEHRIARVTDIFTTNTTSLYPGGYWSTAAASYGPFMRVNPGWVSVSKAGAVSGRRVITFAGDYANYDALVAAIGEDRLDASDVLGEQAPTTRGNYKHLRVRVWGSAVTNPEASTNYLDLPVYGFPTKDENTLGAGEDIEIGLADVAPQTDSDRQTNWMGRGLSVLVSDTGGFSAGAGVGDPRRVLLHKFTAPPTGMAPLHYGGPFGKHPADVITDMYSSAYAGSTGARLPRTNSTAIADLKADARYPRMRFRITEGKQPLGRWLEEHVYVTNQIVPVTDAQGRITPKGLLLPNSSAGVTVTLNSANLRAPHPSFSNTALEQVTVARYRYVREYIGVPTVQGRINLGGNPTAGGFRAFPDAMQGADLIGVVDREHDVISRTSVHGRKVVEFAAPGWHQEYLGRQVPTPFQVAIQYLFGNRAIPNANAMGTHVLQRYADGAVTGTLHCLSTAEAARPGDYVSLTLNSYPNAASNTRGGTRIVQILSRQDTPLGPIYEYLDAGANAQPIAAPTTVSLTAGPSGSTRHAVQIAVGGVQTRALVQVAIGSTRPPAASTKWTDVFSVTSTVARTLGSLPCNTTWHARAWNVKPNRFQSSYAYSTQRATASLTAPSGFAASSAGTYHARLVWTVGESAYHTEVYGDTSTTATFGADNRVATMPPGSNRYTMVELTSNTKYLVGVRHVDAFGGVSAADSTTFTSANSTANYRTPPAPSLRLYRTS